VPRAQGAFCRNDHFNTRHCIDSKYLFNFISNQLQTKSMNQSKILDKDFISISELMEVFDISRATAQRLLKKGEVKSKKLGGKVIIPTKPLREKFL
jgi:predicted DNA-binding protein YlxM (UPF0122 family)